MKNVLIVSATLNSNYKLANDISKIVEIDKNIQSNVISLEDYMLPIYTDSNLEEHKIEYAEVTNKLISHFSKSNAIIFCAPEYNGSIPPILNNAFAWISTNTKNWREAFDGKFAFIATSSGGPGNKFLISLRIQLEHLGMIVYPRTINISKSKPLDFHNVEKILKQFINLL